MNPTVDVSDSKRTLLDQKLCKDKLSCSVCKSKFRVTFRNRQARLFLGVVSSLSHWERVGVRAY
jgi:hypothetical protein